MSSSNRSYKDNVISFVAGAVTALVVKVVLDRRKESKPRIHGKPSEQSPFQQRCGNFHRGWAMQTTNDPKIHQHDIVWQKNRETLNSFSGVALLFAGAHCDRWPV